jgi:chromosomal replication initiator protein
MDRRKFFRQLGALACASCHPQASSLAIAREGPRHLPTVQDYQVSIVNIQRTVADYYRIRASDLRKQKCSPVVTRSRQVAMTLAHDLTQLPLSEIGKRFGDRDSAAVRDACNQIAALRACVPQIDDDVTFLFQALRP